MTRKQVPTISFEKLSLYKEVSNGKKAKMSFAIRGDYPRITVFTNTKDTDNVYDNLIIAPMSGTIVKSFMSLMRKVVNDKITDKLSIECLNKKWVNGLSTNEVTVQATINLQYNGEGLLNISLTAEDKDEVVFTIGEHLWHTLKPSQYVDEEAFCSLICLAYIDELESVFNKHMLSIYSEETKVYGTKKKEELFSYDGLDKDVDKIIEKHRNTSAV